jgi:hypothetical protein
VCGLLFSQIFFKKIVLAVLNLGLLNYLFFMVRALNFDEFFFGLIKKIWALNFFFLPY